MTAVTIASVAHGGDGVGRIEGKAVFVEGALPGDVVEVAHAVDHGRYERGVVGRLLQPSPARVTPPCPHADVCGGCSWQHAAHAAQLEWKRKIVSEQLAHIARVEAEVSPVVAPGTPFGYRNRMDFAASDGRLTMKRRRSHDSVAIDECHLLAPPLAELFGHIEPLGVVDRVTLRAGIATGESVVIADDPKLLRGVPAVTPRQATIHEEVAGARFRISGRAFFQVNTPGASELVRLVNEATAAAGGGVLVDAYAGGGLFAATVGRRFDRVVAIERERRAQADLVVNAPHAEVLPGDTLRGLGRLDGPIEAVVVDPPRSGMGREVVEAVVGLRPETVCVVSCDPASFARDTGLLTELGYRATSIVPVDLFPQTPHVEVVAAFWR